MLLIFPSLEHLNQHMTDQLTTLLKSLVKRTFKVQRTAGNYEISNNQLVYMAARFAQFYESNNNLMTDFRDAMQTTLMPSYLTREQIFTLLRTEANDKSLLQNPKGLNEV